MVSLHTARLFLAPLVLAVSVPGCGGGGGSASGSPGGGPHPLGPPTVSPTTVKITAIASPATVAVTEPGYGLTYSVNAQPCAGIASIVATSSSTFTITGIGPGSCAITFIDTFNQSVAVPVTVTTSAVTAR